MGFESCLSGEGGSLFWGLRVWSDEDGRTTVPQVPLKVGSSEVSGSLGGPDGEGGVAPVPSEPAGGGGNWVCKRVGTFFYQTFGTNSVSLGVLSHLRRRHTNYYVSVGEGNGERRRDEVRKENEVNRSTLHVLSGLKGRDTSSRPLRTKDSWMSFLKKYPETWSSSTRRKLVYKSLQTRLQKQNLRDT